MKKLSLIIAIAAIFGGAGLAFAQSPALINAQNRAEDIRTNAQQRAKEIRNAASERAVELRNIAQERMEAGQLRACQNREAAMRRIIARMSARAERHLGVFDTIAERVKNFYVERDRTLANYDALVAEVDAKRVVAVAAVEAMQVFEGFDCDGEAPKAMVDFFRQGHRDVIEALQGYRMAIKNLIVGVKSIQGQESSANNNTNTNVNDNTNQETGS